MKKLTSNECCALKKHVRDGTHIVMSIQIIYGSTITHIPNAKANVYSNYLLLHHRTGIIVH